MIYQINTALLCITFFFTDLNLLKDSIYIFQMVLLQGMDGGQPVVGTGSVQRSVHTHGRYSFARTAGQKPAGKAGQRDWHLPCAQGALLSVLR